MRPSPYDDLAFWRRSRDFWAGYIARLKEQLADAEERYDNTWEHIDAHRRANHKEMP